MESSKITTHSSYRIEKRPGGGFIAIPLEGNGTAVEAPTHTELQQDPKPGGGFVAHSDAPGAEAVEGATQQEVESKLLQKYLGAGGKELLPEISRLLHAGGDSTEFKAVINQNTTTAALGDAEQKSAVRWAGTGDVSGAQFQLAGSDLPSGGNDLDNYPIVPETTTSWKVFAVALVLLGIACLLYFLLH